MMHISGRHSASSLWTWPPSIDRSRGAPRSSRGRPAPGSWAHQDATAARLDPERAPGGSVDVVDPTMSPAQAAEALGVPAETLRYWERAGLLAVVGRDAGGRRRYDAGDLAYVDVVRCLRATGMAVRDVRTFTDLVRDGPGTAAARLDLLRAHRAAVLAARAERDAALVVIDEKITTYEEQTR